MALFPTRLAPGKTETKVLTLETKIIFFLNSGIIMSGIITRHFGILISLNFH